MQELGGGNTQTSKFSNFKVVEYFRPLAPQLDFKLMMHNLRMVNREVFSINLLKALSNGKQLIENYHRSIDLPW
jgi:hypothetical protein